MEDVKLVLEVPAPAPHGKIVTIYDHHCFACHCHVAELGEYERHSWSHQVMNQRILTARSEGEAMQLRGLLARYGR